MVLRQLLGLFIFASCVTLFTSKSVANDSCLAGVFSRLVFKTLDADLDILKSKFDTLRPTITSQRRLNIDANRLINTSDWEKANTINTDSLEMPWNYYGKDTMLDWSKTKLHVDDLPYDTPIDAKLFKDIHERATEHLFYKGYEYRRADEKLAKGLVTQEEYQKLLEKIRRQENISGTDHHILGKVFRSEPLDELPYTGSTQLPSGDWCFTKEEFDAISKNPFITIDPATVKVESPDVIFAKGHYTLVKDIPQKVDSVLARVNKEISTATSKTEIVKIVVQMEKDLLSIHAFNDGNGRTVRLLGDYILSRNGLPPSLYSNENDLVMPIAEAVKYQIQGMKDYISEWEKVRAWKSKISITTE